MRSLYKETCESELALYEQIGELAKGLSGKREQKKADLLIEEPTNMAKSSRLILRSSHLIIWTS